MMASINIIAAIAKNNAIGLNGKINMYIRQQCHDIGLLMADY